MLDHTAKARIHGGEGRAEGEGRLHHLRGDRPAGEERRGRGGHAGGQGGGAVEVRGPPLERQGPTRRAMNNDFSVMWWG